MKKNFLFLLSVTTFLLIVDLAQAQQPKKVPRIGDLSSFDPARDSDPCPRQFGWPCASVAT